MLNVILCYSSPGLTNQDRVKINFEDPNDIHSIPRYNLFIVKMCIKWLIMTISMMVIPPLGHDEHKLVCEEKTDHKGERKNNQKHFWCHETFQ